MNKKQENKQRLIDFISFLESNKKENLDFLNNIRVYLKESPDLTIVDVVKDYITDKLGVYFDSNTLWNESMETLIFIKYLSPEGHNELLDNFISNISFNQRQVHIFSQKSIKILESIKEDILKDEKHHEFNSKAMDLYLMWFLHSIHVMSNKSNRNMLLVKLIDMISNLFLQHERDNSFEINIDNYKVFDLIKTYGFYEKHNIDLYLSSIKNDIKISKLNVLFNGFGLNVLKHHKLDIKKDHLLIVDSMQSFRFNLLILSDTKINVTHSRLEKIRDRLFKGLIINQEKEIDIFNILTSLYELDLELMGTTNIIFEDKEFLNIIDDLNFDNIYGNRKCLEKLISLLTHPIEHINDLDIFQNIILNKSNFIELINKMDLKNHTDLNLLKNFIDINMIKEKVDYTKLDTQKIDNRLIELKSKEDALKNSHLNFFENQLKEIKFDVEFLNLLIKRKNDAISKQNIKTITLKKKLKR